VSYECRTRRSYAYSGVELHHSDPDERAVRRRYVIIIAALVLAAATIAAGALLAPGGGTAAPPAEHTARPTASLRPSTSRGYCIQDTEDGQTSHYSFDGTPFNDGVHLEEGPCPFFQAP
jgi:hypothetical protein